MKQYEDQPKPASASPSDTPLRHDVVPAIHELLESAIAFQHMRREPPRVTLSVGMPTFCAMVSPTHLYRLLLRSSDVLSEVKRASTLRWHA